MSDTAAHDMVRSLPAVDNVLNDSALRDLAARIPRSTVVAAVRAVLDELRTSILQGNTPPVDDLFADQIAGRAYDLALKMNAPSLRRVINATGIVLHTGLGRAVLSTAARNAVAEVSIGHSNLELDLETGTRGSRRSHYDSLLADLCGAEAGIAVNNNAGAVLLALSALASGGDVIVSRGQLVEIGGSFRLPDIMAKSGARLVEVGTTNRTRLSDYECAITDDTALILRVHPSNFRMVGFTEDVEIDELVSLGHRYGIPVMDDVGSGALVDMAQFGLRGEPLVKDSVRAGADIVVFSGDKLLGGPQAGLMVGRRETIDRVAKDPLARCLRIDKLTIAALESTLKLYKDPENLTTSIPVLRHIARKLDDIDRTAGRLKRAISRAVGSSAHVEIIDGTSQIGGGSLPGEILPTRLVGISTPLMNADDLSRAYRMSEPPVLGRIADNRFLLDPRTLENDEIAIIAQVSGSIFCH